MTQLLTGTEDRTGDTDAAGTTSLVPEQSVPVVTLEVHTGDERRAVAAHTQAARKGLR